MKLIIGLGNVGKEYCKTRHNIGFMVIDNFLGENIKYKTNEFADYFDTSYNMEKTIFIKPNTFMNLSGNAVRYFKEYYKVDLEDILIIQDDLALPTGKIRIKQDSDHGGHNGIKSIINTVGKNILRLKIGINNDHIDDTTEYVLGNLSKKELQILSETFTSCNEIINDFINNLNADQLMNKYN